MSGRQILSFWRSVSCGALVALGLSARASASDPGQLLWAHDAPPGRLGRCTAIGDFGTQVLVVFDGSDAFARLLSAYDDADPAPLWDTAPIHKVHDVRVAAAERDDLFAVATFEQSSASAPRKVVVRQYRSASASPAWQFTLPFDAGLQASFGVDVSDDGARIATWAFDPGSMSTRLYVLAPQSGSAVLTRTLDTGQAPTAGRVTADGRYLYLTAPHWDFVVDLASGATVYQHLVGATIGSAIAISEDGGVLASARNDGKVFVARRDGASYAQWFLHQSPLAGAQFSAIALSGDGTRLACAAFVPGQAGTARVEVLDLSSAAHPLEHVEAFPGAPSGSTVLDVAFTADAATLAVCASGDAAGPSPEIVGLRRTGGAWARVFERNLAVPATDLDLSAERGQVCVLARGFGPAPSYAPDCEVDLVDLEVPELTAAGVPHAAATITLRQETQPASQVRMLASLHLAAQPIPFGPYGALYLEPHTTWVAGSAVADAQGVAQVDYALPAGAGAVGTSLHFQGLQTQPRRLSENFVRVTVVP